MAEKERAPRRSRKEKLTDDIAKLDAKIAECNQKILNYEAKKEELLAEIKEMEAAEKKAAEEAEVKALLSLVKENNISIDELKSMIANRA